MADAGSFRRDDGDWAIANGDVGLEEGSLGGVTDLGSVDWRRGVVNGEGWRRSLSSFNEGRRVMRGLDVSWTCRGRCRDIRRGSVDGGGGDGWG